MSLVNADSAVTPQPGPQPLPGESRGSRLCRGAGGLGQRTPLPTVGVAGGGGRKPSSRLSSLPAIATGAAWLLALAGGCGEPPAKPKRDAKRDDSGSEAAPAVAETRPAAMPKPTTSSDGVRIELRNERDPCERTLCFAGPGPLDSDANRDLGELCRLAPGVVRRCQRDDSGQERCASVWSLADRDAAIEALITTMDSDGDGRLVGAEQCSIHAAGWSEGAIVAAEQLPQALREDPRVPESAAVLERLVLIAPWAPGRESFAVAPNVRQAWIYRYTKSPEADCSRALEGDAGPRLSLEPRCSGATTCWDYDYSREPLLAFRGRRGVRSGAEVGHCSMVGLVAKVGQPNLREGLEAYVDLLPHRSDGSPGGRPRPKGPDGSRLQPEPQPGQDAKQDTK